MIECFACKVFWCQISASATSVSYCLLFVMGETAASQAWSDTLDRVGKKDNETGEGLSGSWRIGKKTEEWIQMGRASLKKSDKKTYYKTKSCQDSLSSEAHHQSVIHYFESVCVIRVILHLFWCLAVYQLCCCHSGRETIWENKRCLNVLKFKGFMQKKRRKKREKSYIAVGNVPPCSFVAVGGDCNVPSGVL